MATNRIETLDPALIRPGKPVFCIAVVWAEPVMLVCVLYIHVVVWAEPVMLVCVLYIHAIVWAEPVMLVCVLVLCIHVVVQAEPCNDHYSKHIFIHTGSIQHIFICTPRFYSACLQCSSVLFHMRVVHHQLRGDHECSKLFILHVFLACVVSFHIIKLENVEPI